MVSRCLLIPLAIVATAFHAGPVFAQDTSPPGQTERDACAKEYVPLRKEAEERGKLIKAATECHAPPEETCKLIGNFGRSEIRMIKYIDVNWTRCGIQPQVADQLKAGLKNTVAMLRKVCATAHGEPFGPVGDFDDIPVVR